MKSKTTNGFGLEISKAVILRFFLTLAVYVAAIVFMLVFARIYLSRFIWYDTDPFYRLFRFIDNHVLGVVVFFGGVGFVVIFIFYWRKTLGFIDAVVEASEILADRDDRRISLPPELNRIETRMNSAKQNAIQNALLAADAERRKDEMIMYLAHDIKTPLTSVIGYLCLIEETSSLPPEQKAEYIRIALEKAYRLEKLVGEFFEITRYNFQTPVLTKEDINLCYMLIQISDEFYPSLTVKDIAVSVRVPEDMTARGDPDKLARVFNNILKNAAAYSPRGSAIDITASAGDKTISVVFTNPGNIPADQLPLIFDKFYRLDSSRSSDTGGSGLGLAVAKEIIILHGGNIRADCGGNQISFTVELPRVSTPS